MPYKDLNKILFIVQAREGSTRVKNKMTDPLYEEVTLFSHCIDIVTASSLPLTNFKVSVVGEPFLKVAQDKNVNVFERSQHSAKESKDVRKILEWCELPYDYYMMISACCPFLKSSTIDDFIYAFINSSSEGMMSVVERKNILWNKNKDVLNFNAKEDFQTQTLESYYEAAHCLYAGSMKRLREENIHMGTFTHKEDPTLFEISEKESFDVDYEWHFNLIKNYFQEKN